jgi:hypothetical protein
MRFDRARDSRACLVRSGRSFAINGLYPRKRSARRVGPIGLETRTIRKKRIRVWLPKCCWPTVILGCEVNRPGGMASLSVGKIWTGLGRSLARSHRPQAVEQCGRDGISGRALLAEPAPRMRALTSDSPTLTLSQRERITRDFGFLLGPGLNWLIEVVETDRFRQPSPIGFTSPSSVSRATVSHNYNLCFGSGQQVPTSERVQNPTFCP